MPLTRLGEDASVNIYRAEMGYRRGSQNPAPATSSEHRPVLVHVGQVEEEQEAVLPLASSSLHILAIPQEGKAFRASAAYVGQPVLQESRHCREFWGGHSGRKPHREHRRAGNEHMSIYFMKNTAQGSRVHAGSKELRIPSSLMQRLAYQERLRVTRGRTRIHSFI